MPQASRYSVLCGFFISSVTFTVAGLSSLGGSPVNLAAAQQAYPPVSAAAASFLPVTRSLRTAAGRLPLTYTVRPGDTLSAIAKTLYGDARWWPQIYRANAAKITSPEALQPGVTLLVTMPRSQHMPQVPAKFIPRPPPAVPMQPASAPASSAPPAQQPSFSGAPGSYQACVIARESGGNPTAVNPSSGAGGLYQFLPSTWASLGYSGLPQNASVATQNQAFQQLYAQQGSAPWVSDGC